MAVQPELVRLGAQLLLVRPGAGDDEAHVGQALDQARQCLEGELEALLVHEPPHEQH